MIGRQLSHYRIVAELGSGGMGTVYRAEDMRLGCTVALKLLHATRLTDPGQRERLLHEARAVSALDHPNLVPISDVGEHDGQVFLAMPLIEGHTLRDALRGPMPPSRVVAIGRALAEALAHAHARGVVHRDVKPDNAMVDGDGHVRLADFGLAPVDDAASRSQGGAIVGTVAYVAPELLNGAPADARSDLYALGVTLYELCVGTPPFDGTAAELSHRVAHEAPPPLPMTVPSALADLIGRLLEKDPACRPARAEPVADTLGAMIPAPEMSVAAGPSTTSEPSAGGSIVMLPLRNLADAADADCVAGIGEDLFADLMRLQELRVVPPARVAALGGVANDAVAAGRALGVATVLDGGVSRSGSRVGVTARLLRVDTAHEIWAVRHDREWTDLSDVLEDITRRVADALRIAFEPERAEARRGRRSTHPRALELRSQARAALRTGDDLHRALALLEEALREDPDYALAHADFAETGVRMVCEGRDHDRGWLDHAERGAERALELAPGLPEALRARGHVRLHRGRMELALRDLHDAVAIDPRGLAGLSRLAYAWLCLGEPTRAEVVARRGMALDPAAPRFPLLLAAILLRQRRDTEARAAAEHALAINPERRGRSRARARVALAAHGQRDASAIQSAATATLAELGEGDAFARALAGFAAAATGEAERARTWLADASIRDSDDPDTARIVARAHLLLDDRAAAITALERARALVDADELRSDRLLSTLGEETRVRALIATGAA